MGDHSWDPERYLAYADERSRPFTDLLARVGASEVDRVVDLGCGPGNLTRLVKERWPGADVLGLDTSPEMVRHAKEHVSAGLTFEQGDLRTWRADPPVDVVVANATLQWVPGHLDLLPRLVGQVVPGGWLAFQVPANLDQPSHTLLAELCRDERFQAYVGGVPHLDAHEARVYLDTLLGLGCRVDAWETTYLHLLQGDDPVFTWVSGTGARPVLQALPAGVRDRFEDEYRRRLRAAYPTGRFGTVLPFRRVFVVARTSTGNSGEVARP